MTRTYLTLADAIPALPLRAAPRVTAWGMGIVGNHDGLISQHS
jgi:hypothetical protein